MVDFDRAAVQRAKERAERRKQEKAQEKKEKIASEEVMVSAAPVEEDFTVSDAFVEDDTGLALAGEVEEETVAQPKSSIPSFIQELRQLQGERADIDQSRSEALTNIAEIDTERAAKEAEALSAHDQRALELDKRKQTLEAQIKEENAQLFDDIEKERTALSKMSPKTFWQKADTMDKVLMSLTILAGSFGSPRSGGKNVAIETMNRAIERDFNRQTQLINRKFSALRDRENTLVRKTALKRQELAAIEGYKQASFDQAERVTNGYKLATKGPEAKAKLDIALADIEESRNNHNIGMTNRIQKLTLLDEERAAKAASQTFENLPKESKVAAEIVIKKNAGLIPIRSEIASALQQLKDPNLSRDDKLRVGSQLVKTLNSTQGSDAVGAEEAARLAGELQGNISKIAEGAGKGVLGGVIAGGAIGSVGAGAGAVPGAAIGGGLGLIGGGLMGLVDAIDDPGGLRFRADVDGFTKRVDLTLKKVDATLERNDQVTSLIKKGVAPAKAARLVESQMMKKFNKGK
jgi:hypothetical protein